jgi:hypothetical protein
LEQYIDTHRKTKWAIPVGTIPAVVLIPSVVPSPFVIESALVDHLAFHVANDMNPTVLNISKSFLSRPKAPDRSKDVAGKDHQEFGTRFSPPLSLHTM